MAGLTKSEQKLLGYLQQMFPGYAWGKTAGGGQLDFMGAPPPDADLPMLFVESKCAEDRTRESQNEWAKSEIGLRCRKFVVYSPDPDGAPCFLYTWDDWLMFVEDEDVVARIARKDSERRASVGLAPGNYYTDRSGVDAHMRIAADGTITVLKGSTFRLVGVPKIQPWIESLRQSLIGNLKLIQDGDVLRLTEDTVFNSTSAAAAAVLGRSASGNLEWKAVKT